MDLPAKKAIHSEKVSLGAPIDRVWEALTGASMLSSWLADECEVDPRVDGSFRLAWGAGGRRLDAAIEVFVPPRHLKVAGTYQTGRRKVSVTLDFQLTERKNTTQLEVEERHGAGGVRSAPCVEWMRAILQLHNLMEPKLFGDGAVDAILNAFASLQSDGILKQVARAEPAIKLDEYRGILRSCPPPNDEQIDAFVLYVAGAHSWYKHLPLWHPGVRFSFFFDPLSAHDVGVGEDGRLIYAPRVEKSEESPGEGPALVWSHYSWMTTKRYRSRFAYLDYDTGSTAPLFCSSGRYLRVPDELVAVGSVALTAVVHDHFPRFGTSMLDRVIKRSGQVRRWPEETGGDETVGRLVDLSKEVAERKPKGRSQLQKLEALIQPERSRQRVAMREAIHRVRELVYA